MNLKVVDAICGFGKTYHIKKQIQNITSDTNKRVLFASPYRDEVFRVAGVDFKYKKGIAKLKVNYSPKYINNPFNFKFNSNLFIKGTADSSINKIIDKKENIACTHRTLEKLSIDTIYRLKQENYEVIIDEAPRCISKMEFDDDQLEVKEYETLVRLGVLNEDKQGKVTWGLTNNDFLKRYDDIREDFEIGNCWKTKVSDFTTKKHPVLIWEMHKEIFTVPENVYVYTYRLQGTFFFQFLKYHDIQFQFEDWTKDKMMLHNRTFMYHDLVNLYVPSKGMKIFDDNDKSFNAGWYKTIVQDVGIKLDSKTKSYAFNPIFLSNPKFNPIVELSKKISTFMSSGNSKIHLNTSLKSDFEDMILIENDESFPNHEYYKKNLEVESISADEKAWTTFNKYKELLLPHHSSAKTFTEDQFIVYNQKASNAFSNVKRMAYTVNVHPHPDIKHFFETGKNRGKNSVIIDKDEYALSELLQWVFRSRIRNGFKIDLFIVPVRMRNLFEKWLLEMRMLYEETFDFYYEDAKRNDFVGFVMQMRRAMFPNSLE